MSVNGDKTKLVPGTYVKGKIFTENSFSYALPEDAVIQDGYKNYIFSVKKESNKWAFKPVEVIIGAKENEWVEVKPLNKIPKGTKFTYNKAYYLMAHMKKEETEHSH